MSKLADRDRADVRSIFGGDPALTRADVYKAREAFERHARSLIAKNVRHTLHVLLSFMNINSLQCNPSQVTLAAAVGCQRSTLGQHLKLLEAAGLLRRVSMPVRRGRRSRESDGYIFSFDLVGLPDLCWKPPRERMPSHRRPVRAADGRFRRAADAVLPVPAVVADLFRRVVVSADPFQVVQGEGKAGTLDAGCADRRQASARFQDDLRASPCVASQWWVKADEAAENAAIEAELAQRGAGLLFAKGWL